MNIELNLETIELTGQKKESENYRFRSYLKSKSSEKIDRIVNRLNTEITNKIDCTDCGNCCNLMSSMVKQTDSEEISNFLKISITEFQSTYLEIGEENELYFKHRPCKFLEDKKCTIYNIRPNDCQSYPHTQKQGFIFRLLGVIENYSICPIVYNLVEQLKRELHFK
jgi:uncharacterized protein